MAELTIEQQRAIALANARRRAAEADAGDVGTELPDDMPMAQKRALLAKRDLSIVAGHIEPTLDDVGRSIARGVPVIGSFLDEANAATNATLAPLIDRFLGDSYQKLPGATWQDRYNQAVAIQRGKDKSFDEAAPALSTGLQVLGGVGSAVGALKAAPELAVKVLGMGGKDLPGKVGASMLAGGGTGLVGGFGAGESGPVDRLASAGQGGVAGGIIGAGVPLVGAGLGKVVEKGLDAIKGRGNPVSSRAADMISKDLAAEGTTIDDVAAKAAGFGPSGMLADASETLKLRAEQIAQSDNAARSGVITKLKERSGEAQGRINSAYDESIGANPNVYNELKRITGDTKRNADTLYEQARRENSPVDVSPVIQAIDDQLMSPIDAIVRPGSELPDDAVDSALKWVRSHMTTGAEQRTGIDRLDRLERRIRARVDASFKSGRSDEGHALDQVRKTLVQQMKGSSPVYKLARETFADDKAVENAFAKGRELFQSKTHPDFLAAEVAEMSLAERDALRLGVRAAVDEAQGRVQNGALAGRTLLDADWNERKILEVLGPEEGKKLVNTLAGEQAMAGTANQALSNSATSRRLDNPFRNQVPDNPRAGVIRSLLNLKFGDAGERAIQHVKSAMEGRSVDNFAGEVAPLITSQGAERDRLVQALLARAQGNQGASDAGRNVEAWTRMLLQSGAEPARRRDMMGLR